VTTSPPASAHLIGWALRMTGTPWIADLRDGWTFDPPRPPWPTRAQSMLDCALERGVLGRADGVVAVTEPIAHDLSTRLGRRVSVITNGFDPEETPAKVAPELDPERHSLVHTGRLNAVGRTPHAFFDGLLEYLDRHPDGSRRLEIVLAGPVSADQQRFMDDPRFDGLVRSVGNLDRSATLALQRSADTLLVLAEGNAVRPGRSVATGKLFEYLGAGRPILVLGEESEAARIVRDSASGIAASANDPRAIAEAVQRVVDGEVTTTGADVGRFGWPQLGARWEREIESCLG
jgi:glycosyltransferase involved in cell wall biosynthesis